MPKFTKLLSVRGKEKWLELYRRLTGKEWSELEGQACDERTEGKSEGNKKGGKA